MNYDGLKRDGVSLCIEHFPNRKRPFLVAGFKGFGRFKVAEITNEEQLRKACSVLFGREEVVGE